MGTFSGLDLQNETKYDNNRSFEGQKQLTLWPKRFAEAIEVKKISVAAN